MSNKIKLRKGDVDDFYEPSDSDDEYTEREKSLLKKARTNNKRKEETEKEVLAFDADDDDDEAYDEFHANSDFEEEDTQNDGIPDERAWGKKRRDFYSTDFVDQDYSSYTVNEEQAAEQEEEEARAIQLRLAKQLNEADFTLDVFSSDKKKSAKDQPDTTSIHLKSDLSDLSQREKQRMFRKESPEFEGLVADFEQRIQESQAILEPVLEYFNRKEHGSLPIIEFVQTKNELILTYCSNVAFYLVLKAKRISIKNHPLVKRLVQMRQLLLQLEEKYESCIRPQLEKLMSAISSGKDIEILAKSSTVLPAKKQKKAKLNIVKAFDNEVGEDEPMDETEEDEDDDLQMDDKAKPTQSDSEEDEQEDEAEDMGEDDERRQITYQMSKNKGLTPHRKKELRNPRVKHRNKFRKAIIRRKGAVRTVRKETKRYGGEVSGIKASTKKGIKIK